MKMTEAEIIEQCREFLSGERDERIAARQWLTSCKPFLSVADEFRGTGFAFFRVAEMLASDDPGPLSKLALERLRQALADQPV